MTRVNLQIPSAQDGFYWKLGPSGELSGFHLHSHRELELNLVVAGRGEYFIQGGRYPLKPGSLVWLFPGQPHLLVEASADFTMHVAVFRQRLIRRISHPDEVALLTCGDPQQVYVQAPGREAFAFLEAVCQRLASAGEDETAYVNSTLGFLLRCAWETGSSARLLDASARIHPAVERAIHLMRDGWLDGNLPELSVRAGMSYSRLCGLFQSEIGLSIGAYRERLRVEKFLQLCSRHPQRTLLDLALESGFGSYAQCHRCVKRQTGHGPSEARKAALRGGS